MKRRKFFQLASVGAAGVTMGSSCKQVSQEPGEKSSIPEIKKAIPDYRNMIKTSFTSGRITEVFIE